MFTGLNSVADALYLQFILYAMLIRTLNIFCTLTLALPSVCVHCAIWLVFCSSCISCFPSMLIRYCLSDSEMVPVVPYYYWCHFCFYILHALYVYFKVFILYYVTQRDSKRWTQFRTSIFSEIYKVCERFT